MLNGALWASSLFSSLSSNGWNGSHLFNFCFSIGMGSANYLIGKSFTTSDTGTGHMAFDVITGPIPPASGTGTKASGISVSSGLFQSSFLFYMNTFFQMSVLRPELLFLASALGDTFTSQMQTVSLNSTHTGVYSGTGNINPLSYNTSGDGWGDSIKSYGLINALLGIDWPNYCKAIGFAYNICLNVSSASVNITGFPIPPLVATVPPPVPVYVPNAVPGTGTGNGSIF